VGYTATRFLACALVLGLVYGGLSMVPLAALEGPGCDPGCCQYTVDCGSPTAYMCCLPKDGEAPCSQASANYCCESKLQRGGTVNGDARRPVDV
jgi:hypothetical protein